MSVAGRDARLESAGQRLHGRLWTVRGDRPTLVLLSGLGFHVFEYEQLASLLVDHGFNCLAFDYRGHGRSEGRRGRWKIGDLADDASCAIGYVRARFSGAIGVFGNSLGAMVGMEVAARDRRITSVVASNCPDRLGDFLMTPFRSALFSLAKAVARVVPLRISVNHFYSYSQLIDDPVWVDIISADASIARARRLSVTAYKSLLEGWDGASTAAQVRQPLLVLQGERDRLQPVEQSERVYADATEPKELILTETGHLPHLEKPELLSGILVGWFSRTLTHTHLPSGCEPLGDA